MCEGPLTSREDQDHPRSPPAQSLQKTAGTGKPPLGEGKPSLLPRKGREDSDPFSTAAHAGPPPTWPSCPSMESWRHHERPWPGPPHRAAASHRTHRPQHRAPQQAQLQKLRCPSAQGRGCHSTRPRRRGVTQATGRRWQRESWRPRIAAAAQAPPPAGQPARPRPLLAKQAHPTAGQPAGPASYPAASQAPPPTYGPPRAALRPIS